MLLSGHTGASFESEVQSEAARQICHPDVRCLNRLSRIRILLAVVQEMDEKWKLVREMIVGLKVSHYVTVAMNGDACG